jgi:hypothetical protein
LENGTANQDIKSKDAFLYDEVLESVSKALVNGHQPGEEKESTMS